MIILVANHKEHLVVAKVGFKNMALMRKTDGGGEGDKEGEREEMRVEKK